MEEIPIAIPIISSSTSPKASDMPKDSTTLVGDDSYTTTKGKSSTSLENQGTPS